VHRRLSHQDDPGGCLQRLRQWFELRELQPHRSGRVRDRTCEAKAESRRLSTFRITQIREANGLRRPRNVEQQGMRCDGTMIVVLARSFSDIGDGPVACR
jgi:hypothetical protein